MRNALEMYRNTKYNINTIKQKAVIDSANPRVYNKETVYKFSFLIGSGHFLYCLPLSDFRLPRYKQYSSMSIPKSNSKIVSLSLFVLSNPYCKRYISSISSCPCSPVSSPRISCWIRVRFHVLYIIRSASTVIFQ